jgi:hypothetical protein
MSVAARVVVGLLAAAIAPAAAAAHPLELDGALHVAGRIGLGGATLAGFDPASAVEGAEASTRPDLALAVGGGVVWDAGPLGFQLDLLLARRGVRFTVAGAGDVEGSFRLTYLDLAPLARVAPWPDAAASPYLALGPQASLQLASAFERDGRDADAPSPRRFDLAGVVAAGVGVGRPGARFAFELRLGIGLLDVTDESPDATTARHRVLLLLVGYER